MRQGGTVLERMETERLVLRPIGSDDVDLLVELDSDPEVMRFLTGRPSTREEVEATVRDHLGHRWIAIERTGAGFVGWFGLVPTDDDTFEIGYRLGRRWWGRGLATEGTGAIIDAAFGSLGATRVTAQTMAANQRSRSVMQRCGMRYARTFHPEFDDPLPGTEHGEVEYELTVDQWRAIGRESPRSTATDEAYGLGYERVDDDPNVAVLLATMSATAGWEATRRLRAWERDRLALGGSHRLLDVGCGLGEAALVLAEDLDADGEVVGVDVSAEMIDAARARAAAAGCRARFTVGDACALDEPDDHFDVVRSERLLQWLPDPVVAVAEMARVVRPGGLVSLIDTDWSTFTIDVGDDDLAERVRATMRTERGRPSNIGRRLRELVVDVGLAPIAGAEATHTWDAWNPDESPAPDGCFSMESLATDLVDAGQLASAECDRFVSTIHRAARDGRFSMSLTMYAVIAAAPDT